MKINKSIIKDKLKEKFKESGKVILIILLVCITATIYCSILRYFFGATDIYFNLLFFMFAPLNEEFCKRLAVVYDVTYSYTFTFALFEMFMYVPQIMYCGLSLYTAILLRIPAFIMHMTTAFIIKYYYKRGRTNYGFLSAIITHTWFNVFIDII